ncbi:MAG: hypothetical protein LOD90_02075 [Symbiobacteriaceae bacterium]
MKIRVALKLSPRDLERRLARSPTIVREELTQAIWALGRAAQRTAKRKAPVDTGLLRSTIELEKKPLRAWIGSTRRHAAPMEEGARPHWPPHQPIYNWVWRNRAKMGLVTPSGRAARGASARLKVEAIAFLVRRAISRRGLSGRGYLKAALDDVRNRAPRIVGAVARRIAMRLVSR